MDQLSGVSVLDPIGDPVCRNLSLDSHYANPWGNELLDLSDQFCCFNRRVWLVLTTLPLLVEPRSRRHKTSVDLEHVRVSGRGPKASLECLAIAVAVTSRE